MENEEVKEPDFESWTFDELFYHLIDLHQIPYEEEMSDWVHYRAELIRMCKESYNRQNIEE
jgi:hypothetical protein